MACEVFRRIWFGTTLSGICNAAHNTGQFAIVRIKLNIPGKVYQLHQDKLGSKVAFIYLLN